MDWKRELVIAHLVKQEIAKIDFDGLWENTLPEVLASEEQAGEPVSFTLQSLDDTNLAFQIIAPTALGFGYELELSDAEEALLKKPAAEDVAVMIVLYKQAEGGTIAPSLRAPLIINLKERIGLQKVLNKVTTNVTLSNLVAKV